MGGIWTRNKIALRLAIGKVMLCLLLDLFWPAGGQASALGACASGLRADPALPPVGFTGSARSNPPIALAIWIGDGEALAWPAFRGAMISGEAGATVVGASECQITLPAGYHAALRFVHPNERLTQIAFGVCQTEGGLCEWIEISRP
jgi:hypothetical protein